MVIACFNNTDSALPDCGPRELSSFSILHPRSIPAPDNALGGNREAIEQAFAALLDPARPELGWIHGFPLSSEHTNLCSHPFAVNVRQQGNSRGAEDIIVDTFGSSEQGSPRHRSRLRLICMP
jgi:hypothetical protein